PTSAVTPNSPQPVWEDSRAAVEGNYAFIHCDIISQGQNTPDFIFMDDNAPAHRGRIIREWLLEAGVPQMECPALSLDLNPTENLWDHYFTLFLHFIVVLLLNVVT
uniref:Tc1-like transposase DDE domain-containing protein n=1 Tax=Mola mola TaxID=94237 RepID=A0A3Q3WQ69_MOLML